MSMLKIMPVERLDLWNHWKPQALAKIAQPHNLGAQRRRISHLFVNVSS